MSFAFVERSSSGQALLESPFACRQRLFLTAGGLGGVGRVEFQTCEEPALVVVEVPCPRTGY